MELILATIAGALLYRLRGGLFSNIARSIHASTGSSLALWLSKQRTQLMRLIWAAPTAVLIWSTWNLPQWEIAALTVSVFASMAFIGNGDYLDLKREQPIVDMVGLLRNLIAIAPAAYFAPVPAAAYFATGAVHAQIYRLSHRVTGSSELAEALVGALSWFAIVVISHA